MNSIPKPLSLLFIPFFFHEREWTVMESEADAIVGKFPLDQ